MAERETGFGKRRSRRRSAVLFVGVFVKPCSGAMRVCGRVFRRTPPPTSGEG